jgi:hypothetical protein
MKLLIFLRSHLHLLLIVVPLFLHCTKTQYCKMGSLEMLFVSIIYDDDDDEYAYFGQTH